MEALLPKWQRKLTRKLLTGLGNERVLFQKLVLAGFNPSLMLLLPTIENAKLTETVLSAVAVTIGPGLSLCLRGNLAAFYNLSAAIRIGYTETILNTEISPCNYDAVGVQKARRVAGKFRGHNLLVLAHDLGKYVQLGTTVDDAIGEAYDKTARWLGLDMGRGGGPALEELAREGDAHSIKFSTPMQQHKDCNFSYAGLKTQVKLAIESKCINTDIPVSSADVADRSSRADIAASFQVVSGGVASNLYVRTRLDHVVQKNGLRLVCPPPSLCTDNGQPGALKLPLCTGSREGLDHFGSMVHNHILRNKSGYELSAKAMSSYHCVFTLIANTSLFRVYTFSVPCDLSGDFIILICLIGVMIAWTGIEHFRLGRFDPPPPADEPEDSMPVLEARSCLRIALFKASLGVAPSGIKPMTIPCIPDLVC
ncbi:glutamated carboxypeptidase [Asimina triloba]